MQLLKKQRDAVGWVSIQWLTTTLQKKAASATTNADGHIRIPLWATLKSKVDTKTYEVLHQIAEKLHRRSLIFLFTDMFQSDQDSEHFLKPYVI
jgi:5-hydroxyisourate hydrolase-like protein (transthyretin family)